MLIEKLLAVKMKKPNTYNLCMVKIRILIKTVIKRLKKQMKQCVKCIRLFIKTVGKITLNLQILKHIKAINMLEKLKKITKELKP